MVSGFCYNLCFLLGDPQYQSREGGSENPGNTLLGWDSGGGVWQAGFGTQARGHWYIVWGLPSPHDEHPFQPLSFSFVQKQVAWEYINVGLLGRHPEAKFQYSVWAQSPCLQALNPLQSTPELQQQRADHKQETKQWLSSASFVPLSWFTSQQTREREQSWLIYSLLSKHSRMETLWLAAGSACKSLEGSYWWF